MKKLATLTAGLLASLLALEARADDTSLEGLLSEEVVTSVSKTAESSQDAPALTRSISAEEIRRYGMTSIDEAIDFLGVGVHVVRGVDHAEVTVRGVGFPNDRSNHVLILVDGHVVNEPLFGDAPIDQRLGVPLELVDHIELVLGPGSAVYGSNAVLAVVNVVTKSAKANAGFHATAEAGAVGTVRSTLTFGQSFNLLGKRAGVTAGLSYYRQRNSIDFAQQDLGRDPFTQQPLKWGGHADDAYRSDVPGLYLRFVREGLEIAGRATIARIGDPAGLSDFDDGRAGHTASRGSIRVTQTIPLERRIDLTATAYVDVFSNRRDTFISRHGQCPFVGVNTCDYREDERSNRTGGELRATFDWLQNGRVVTALGATASVDHVGAGTSGINAASRAPLFPREQTIDISSVVNAAANGQQTVKPFSWLDLSAGARLDWRQINEGNGEAQVFQPVFTPRLALAARPWSGATAKLLYADAFRAPNPYELDASGPPIVPSGGLPPERAHNIEAIFEQRVDAQRFTLGVFRSTYRGIINRLVLTPEEIRAKVPADAQLFYSDPNTPAWQYQSDDNVETRGFNLGFDGAVLHQKLRFGASFTGAVARADGVERIMTAPQAFGNGRVSYELGGVLPTVALATTFGGSAPTDRAYDSGYQRVTYAPPSLEVRATLTGSIPGVKGLSYRVIVIRREHELSPFAVGPRVRAVTGLEAVPLTPTDAWNALIGLQYDFGD